MTGRTRRTDPLTATTTETYFVSKKKHLRGQKVKKSSTHIVSFISVSAVDVVLVLVKHSCCVSSHWFMTLITTLCACPPPRHHSSSVFPGVSVSSLWCSCECLSVSLTHGRPHQTRAGGNAKPQIYHFCPPHSNTLSANVWWHSPPWRSMSFGYFLISLKLWSLKLFLEQKCLLSVVLRW